MKYEDEDEVEELLYEDLLDEELLDAVLLDAVLLDAVLLDEGLLDKTLIAVASLTSKTPVKLIQLMAKWDQTECART